MNSVSLIEYKIEQTLPENQVENYLTSPPIDNTIYPSINHINTNINGKSNNQTIVYGNELLFSEGITETTNYILNGQNNVIHEQINNKVIDYQYDAYGQQLSTSPNPTFGYNSEYQINDSTQYLRARTYDNSTGRMMQYDTYQGGLNPLSRNHYTYVHNNPVNHEDPSGNCMGVCSTAIIFFLTWTGKKIAKKYIKNNIDNIIGCFGETTYKKYVVGKEKVQKLLIDIDESKYGKVIKEWSLITYTTLSTVSATKKIWSFSAQLSEKMMSYSTENQSKMAGFFDQYYSLLYNNEIILRIKYEKAGIDPNTVDYMQQIFLDAKKAYVNLNNPYYRDYEAGKKDGKTHYNFYYNSLTYLGNTGESASDGRVPSSYIEEYWVPVYVSHGQNETKYK